MHAVELIGENSAANEIQGYIAEVGAYAPVNPKFTVPLIAQSCPAATPSTRRQTRAHERKPAGWRSPASPRT